MPGPGGGRHGGGGRRGGGFGGGSHGGGFGGGHHGPRPGGFGPRPHRPPHHHRPYMGGWYGPRRRSYGGGGSGCLGGLVVMLMLQVILIIALLGRISSCSNSAYPDYQYGYESIGGYYDEELLQDYADEQYAKAFGHLKTYEDNLLLLVVTEEDNASFSWMAWVGDHITSDARALFGGEETVLGEVLLECVNESNYKYSLDSNLVDAVKRMTTEIKHLNLESVYDCTEERAAFDSHLVNNTELPMTEETVDDALVYFTEQTGIPSVIVVVDAAEVFGKVSVQDQPQPDAGQPVETQGFNWLVVIPVVLALGILIYLVINSKKEKEAPVDSEEARRRKQYSEFDDHYK